MGGAAKWFLRTQDETFGPETVERLVEWAKMGRIQPGQEISDDETIWRRVEDVAFLDMRFSIDIGDGNPRGPFNKAAATALLASGRLPAAAHLVEVREPFPAEPIEPVASEPPPVATPEAPANVLPAAEPAVVERIVEVPVEKVVEKIVEKEVRVEIPVEKIVEKVVIDETRVNELQSLLDEERRHTGELQARMDTAAKEAAARETALRAKLEDETHASAAHEAALKATLEEVTAARDEAKRACTDLAKKNEKLSEQVIALEDELKRLPQAASEVADIQAAVFSLLSNESEEILKVIDEEKREFEAFKKLHQERSDKLLERRRELLRKSGANVEEMTRHALAGRPDDPRLTQLRKEYDDFRRAYERTMLDRETQIRDLTSRLTVSQAENARASANAKDVTQLQLEVQNLREQLQTREKDLVAAREKLEEIQRNEATRQQALMTRLASLESPSIGTVSSLETNQSREAKQVKLPGWMRLKR